ncbi:MAG: DUF1028 domain-containing protein [Pseudomonadota bacterium]
MTFSLVARDAVTGQFGVGIASSSPAVAARCAFTRASVGAATSQNVTDPSLGPLALDRLAAGQAAAAALADVTALARFPAYRQILIIDPAGNTAIHSGAEALGNVGEAQGRDVAAAGNLLAASHVPSAMVAAFTAATGHLGDRLLAALSAGRAAGGEAGPIHSAGLQIAGNESWPIVDLRCDWTEACPIDAVAAAWTVYQPQIAAYVQRARDPRTAPAYGVAGDPGA